MKILTAIARTAARLCDAHDAQIYLVEGATMRLVAQHGSVRTTRRLGEPFPVSRGAVHGRAVLTRRTIHIRDLKTAVRTQYPDLTPRQRATGTRTILAAPLLSGGAAVGVIMIRRVQVNPFTSRQIALLQTFADQAVIAIENVRLFTEVQARNRELTESLEQQTATSEVLQVISRSPSDVEPTFEVIAASAARLCEAVEGTVFRFDGAVIHIAAHCGGVPEQTAALRRVFPIPPGRGSVTARAILTRAVVHVPDLASDPEHEYSSLVTEGFHTVLSVPMLRNGDPIGAITVRRQNVRPFSDKQIALLQTFADQAVIAIENVRLFTELQEKNRALTEAHAQVTETLEQQTATAEILRAISGSPTDAQPVFDTIARSAMRLCEGGFAVVCRYDGDLLHLAAHSDARPEGVEVMRRFFPMSPNRINMVGRVILTGAVAQVVDANADPEYGREFTASLGNRTSIGVPMLRDGRPIGAIMVARLEVRPFSDVQIALLQTFADQAVIAIENVRLFKELEVRTQELTRSVGELRALAEVSQAISSTLDLETVLTTIVSRAVQLSGLDGGVVFEYDTGAEEFVHRAATETGGALAEARRATRVRKGEGVVGRTAITLEAVQVPDITAPHAYESRLRGNLIESGVRAVLAVPMVREGHLIGCLVVSRNQPGDFPAETIDLLRTFAAQSALAIQNARLFHEIADKSRQLEAASRHKSEFLANMSHELRTPLNAILGFSEILAQGMFGAVNEKQSEYLHDILESGRHLLSLINDILDLSKIEAGRMELEPADFDLPSAIENALVLVRERAIRRGIRLGSTIDTRLGMISGDERKVKQVLLNLLSNALKFTPEGGQIDVAARLHDNRAEVSVADTGIGIAPTDQDTVFEEFRQVGAADKKAEGTGLGLTLSRKFVELHGGTIWVTSAVGAGSTFTFTLPVSPCPAS